MKRNHLIAPVLLAAASLCLLLTSCEKEKEGQYNPGKKITRLEQKLIYDGEVEETDLQTWNWDGKLLTSINHVYREEGELLPETYSETFTYDKKNRLLTATDGDERVEFFYSDKDVLERAEVYERNVHTMTLRFTHEDGRITRIEADNYWDDLDKCRLGVLRLVAGEQMGKCMGQSLMRTVKQARKQGAKEVVTVTLKLDWEGDNVKRMTASSGYSTTTFDFTYDTKKNPHRGLFSVTWLLDDETMRAYSANNILTYTYRSGGYSDTYRFTYTYDGDYPATCTFLIDEGETLQIAYTYEK